ncbi:MAG: VWA domain-containing protein [Rhizobacter sp.]
MKRKSVLPAVLVLTAALVGLPEAMAFKPTQEFGHVGIVRDALTRISVPSTDGTRVFKFSERAIVEIRDAAAGVDEPSLYGVYSPRGEFSTADAHCDDELLPGCTQRIINLKNEVIDLLKASPPNGEKARAQIGKAMHTLQDFFSHSNWINISSGDPGLGINVHASLDPLQTTCDASTASNLVGSGLTNLTTGYFELPPTPIARPGKCNHGLLIAQGIHKDEPGRVGHSAARAAAVNSTESIVKQVLNAPGIAGNDMAVKAFLGVGGTIGFVVDQTMSMVDEIEGVKSGIAAVISAALASPNPPDRYLLVTFADPFVSEALVTDNASTFRNAVNAITLYSPGNRDCPEMSMSGLLRAVNAAPERARLYVYTDASAKDARLWPHVMAQAEAKRIRISFMSSGSCSPVDPVYYTLAAQTGGQVYKLDGTTASDSAKALDLVIPYAVGPAKFISPRKPLLTMA